MFTVRCENQGCDSRLQVRTLTELNQLPRRWVCPICEAAELEDAVNAMARQQAGALSYEVTR